MSAQGLSEGDAVVRARAFGQAWRFAPAGAGADNPGAQLAVPLSVANSMVALRLRLATLGGKVRMPSKTWHRRGVDTLRSGLTCRLGVAQLRDLQRITFALFDWNPAHFDADATTVLSWCDAYAVPPPQLPLLLLRLKRQYDQLCDLRVLEWTDLITRLTPELPEVVVRDWLGLLVVESEEDDAAAAEWFSFLAAGGAVEAVALGVAVGDVEFLEAISQCLLYCPKPAVEQPTPPGPAGAPEGIPADRDTGCARDSDHERNGIAPKDAGISGKHGNGAEAGSGRFVEDSDHSVAHIERARVERPDTDIAVEVPPRAPAQQARLNSLTYPLASAARRAAEPLGPPGPEASESTEDDSTREHEPDLLFEVEPARTGPVFRLDSAGNTEGVLLGELADKALEVRGGRPEKSAATPAPATVGDAPDGTAQDEGATLSAAAGGTGVSVSVIFAFALAFAAVGGALWWWLAGTGRSVDPHGITVERPPAPAAASAEPVVRQPEHSDGAPAAAEPAPPVSAPQAVSPAFPQSDVTGLSPPGAARWSVVYSFPEKATAIAAQRRLATLGMTNVNMGTVLKNGTTYFQLEIVGVSSDVGGTGNRVDSELVSGDAR